MPRKIRQLIRNLEKAGWVLSSRLANYTVGGIVGFVGQFPVAQAAGVSSAIRLIGKSPIPAGRNPDRREQGF